MRISIWKFRERSDIASDVLVLKQDHLVRDVAVFSKTRKHTLDVESRMKKGSSDSGI